MLCLDPELRSSKLSEEAIKLMTSNASVDCSCFLQSNFRAFDKSVARTFKRPKMTDEVKYAEEQLILDDHEGRAFKVIDHLDGLRFFTDG